MSPGPGSQEPVYVLSTTYDMEVADMDFNFNPAEQNMWVQDQRFPATPSMVTLVTAAEKAGCTVVGLTGRNADQKAATIGNLAKVANLGDQFSDLKGGRADRAIKLPNPTYYFP